MCLPFIVTPDRFPNSPVPNTRCSCTNIRIGGQHCEGNRSRDLHFAQFNKSGGLLATLARPARQSCQKPAFSTGTTNGDTPHTPAPGHL